ncbi:DoxX family protein [Candidatus Woesearchaeota archaeon]|nr:DoxX family protein [Candidatus Woesearchaeota archaeon]
MDWFAEHKQWGPVILRTFFGVAFLIAALDKILSFGMAKGMFEGLFGTSLGAPALYLAILIELAGGLMLLLNWHAACAARVLSVFILVALVKTWQIGSATNAIGMLRELLVMNTGGGNTAVNFAYLAGLLNLGFAECETCKGKKRR